MNIFVLTHLDPDGILSARLIQAVHRDDKVDVGFGRWDHYGADFGEKFNPDSYDRIYVTDLGTSEEDLKNEDTISEEYDVDVIHIDHHQTDITFLGPEKAIFKSMPDQFWEFNSKLKIVFDINNCATGLVYNNVVNSKDLGHPQLQKWIEMWTLVGIFADVATDTLGGRLIVDDLRSNHPLLFGRWFKEKPPDVDTGEMKIPLPTLLGRFLNVPRKIAMTNGPSTALRACHEIEELDDFFVLLEDDPERDAVAPSAAMLRRWEEQYRIEMNRIINTEDYQFIDLVTRGYCIIKHPWNIGSDLARLLSRRYKMAVSTINTGLPIMMVSGRYDVPTTGFYNLGLVYNEAVKCESGLDGGGHPRAAGASFKKSISSLDVMNILEQAFIKMTPRKK